MDAYRPLRSTILAAGLTAGWLAAPLPAAAFEGYTGQVIFLLTSYCPEGTVEAAGQSLSVSANQALYSLVMNTYGGDSSNFKLPTIHLTTSPGSVGVKAVKTCIVTNGTYPTQP